VQSRIKPQSLKQEEAALRDQQRALFRRNQAIGLLLVAAAVLGWRLLHTPAGWLFPPGWWRLW
jgi:hypothetical protein